ncbi:MAG: NusG domain II-containing protein [Oscillospiraceae bacterium]|nr:NusG domain II-containing protein [Oscillospiraceae bacterium]
MKILKKSDVVLIAGFVAFAAAFWFIFSPAQGGDTVVIKSNGKIYEEVPLGQNKEIPIYSKEGALTNIVTIQDKEAFVSYASCPGKLCMKHSPIDSGGVIVCLPNRVSVEIKQSDNSKQIFDAVIGR